MLELVEFGGINLGAMFVLGVAWISDLADFFMFAHFGVVLLGAKFRIGLAAFYQNIALRSPRFRSSPSWICDRTCSVICWTRSVSIAPSDPYELMSMGSQNSIRHLTGRGSVLGSMGNLSARSWGIHPLTKSAVSRG